MRAKFPHFFSKIKSLMKDFYIKKKKKSPSHLEKKNVEIFIKN